MDRLKGRYKLITQTGRHLYEGVSALIKCAFLYL